MRVVNAEWSGLRADLLRFVARRVDSAPLREDIVQEAIVRFWLYREKPSTRIANTTGLLRRISLDLIRDHFRHLARVRHVDLSDDLPCLQPSVQIQLEQRQLVEIVTAVVNAMPRLRRRVFLLRRVYGESSKEVAEALGISTGAVNAHIARAVLDLNSAIAKLEERGGIV